MMYAKIKNNQIEVYPYYISTLKQDNPQVSFPKDISNQLLVEYSVYPVKPTAKPDITYKQNIIEKTPINVDGEWFQVWEVQDKPQDEINILNESLREQAYKTESDGLFFKSQRGEIDKQVWINKVAEIKARYN